MRRTTTARGSEGGAGIDWNSLEVILTKDGAELSVTPNVNQITGVITLSLTNVEVGSYNVAVMVKDKVGNQLVNNSAAAFTVDDGAPQITDETVVSTNGTLNNYFVPGTHNIAAVTVADANGIDAEVSYVEINGEHYNVSYDSDANVMSFNLDVIENVVNGTVINAVWHVFDGIGTEATKSVTYTADLEGPAFTEMTPAPNSDYSYGSDIPVIKAHFADNGVGIDADHPNVVATVTLINSTNGGAENPIEVTPTIADGYITLPIDAYEVGTYKVFIRMEDLLGNNGTVEWTFNVTETVAPEITFFGGETNYYFSTMPHDFTMRAKDSGAGLEGEQSINLEVTKRVLWTLPLQVDDEDHLYYVDPVSGEVIVVDYNDPQIVLDSEGHPYMIAVEGTLDWQAASDIDWSWTIDNDGNEMKNHSMDITYHAAFTMVNSANQKDLGVMLRLTVTDRAGNITITTKSYLWDNDANDIAIAISPANGSAFRPDQEINIAVHFSTTGSNIANATVKVMDSQGNVVLEQATTGADVSFTFNTADDNKLDVGEYTVEVTATDVVGNTITKTSLFKVTSTADGSPIDISKAYVYPNPYNPNTKAGMTIALGEDPGLKGVNVFFAVYDMSGRKVYSKVLTPEEKDGKYVITWMASTDNDVVLANGAYIGYIKVNGQTKTIKILIFKK
jgi:hypothetical protein